MKCQLCKVIVSSSYYFCFLSRDNAFVWKVIKIELLISRHKQQCWAGATYNFRNKSDALINKQTQTHNTSTKTQTNTQKQTHKHTNYSGEATYNFRNKSDALIKALAILPDPSSRIQFKAFICLFEENLQILK